MSSETHFIKDAVVRDELDKRAEKLRSLIAHIEAKEDDFHTEIAKLQDDKARIETELDYLNKAINVINRLDPPPNSSDVPF